MAQVRRPVPFRTRKLRPGTAMVLHPTGCGRVARRRTTRTGSPSEHTPQGAFPISETLTTQTHTPPQKHPGLLALMRPTSGTIPGRPRRRGRRETARRVPISAGNPENSTSVTVESRRPGLLPPVCCADGSPPEGSQKLAWLWGRSTLASAMHYFTPKRCATSNKIMYHDKAQVQRAADQSLIERGVELWVYRCEFCGCWHLTHRDPQSSYRHVPLSQQLKPHSRKKGYKPRRR